MWYSLNLEYTRNALCWIVKGLFNWAVRREWGGLSVVVGGRAQLLPNLSVSGSSIWQCQAELYLGHPSDAVKLGCIWVIHLITTNCLYLGHPSDTVKLGYIWVIHLIMTNCLYLGHPSDAVKLGCIWVIHLTVSSWAVSDSSIWLCQTVCIWVIHMTMSNCLYLGHPSDGVKLGCIWVIHLIMSNCLYLGHPSDYVNKLGCI